MTARQKRELLILLGTAGVIFILIAASLNRLDLNPGLPLPSFEKGEVVVIQSETNSIPTLISFRDFLKYLLIFVLIGNLVYLVYRIIKGVSWREVGKVLMSGFIIMVAVGVIILLTMALLPQGKIDVPAITLPTLEPEPVVHSPLEPAPQILFWVVGIILAIICIIVLIWILKSTNRKHKPMDKVQFEAEKAYQEILSGRDIRDVIVKCYRHMSEALEYEKGLERKSSMTTGEFESLLENEGIPYEPVHQLTRLFELVRYGHELPNRQDEQIAVDCLSAIVHYCQEMKKAN